MKGLILVAILAVFTTNVFADQLPFTVKNLQTSESVLKSADESYFTISSVEVNEVQEEFEFPEAQSNTKSLGQVIATLESLIAFGKKVYAIVEKGKPVVNVNLKNKVSVLPNVEQPQVAMYGMTNWQAPKTRVYEVVFKNLYGMKVVKFNYAVTFEYGGKHDGKGAYIAGARIAADSVNVSWGFKFDATADAVSIVNRGSKEDPVAAVTFKLNYTAKSILKEIQSEESFYITGEGAVRKVY